MKIYYRTFWWILRDGKNCLDFVFKQYPITKYDSNSYSIIYI